MIFAPLVSLSENSHEDVRKLQLDCCGHLLREHGTRFHAELWSMSIGIVAGVVSGDHRLSEAVVQAGFVSLQLLVTEYLPNLRPSSLQQVIEVTGKYGSQQQDLNIALTAVGQLWNMSDYLFRNHAKIQEALS